MSNQLLVIKQSEAGEISDKQPAKTALGEVIALQGISKNLSTEAENVNIGVWESTPGKFTRNVKDKEFSHIIAGKCTFTPKDGEPVDIEAGDAVYFPANTEGEWNIIETLRKTYIIFS